MFKYIFFIIASFISLYAVTTFAQDDLSIQGNVSTESDLEEKAVDPSSDEEDGDEPSLEEPSVGESTTFDAGAPPVTEESLEEEDSDQSA